MASVDQLLSELRRVDSARASELTEALKVSQPTVSRLIVAAGERICRMGTGPKVRYALTRSIPTLGTKLPLYRVDKDGKIHRHGILHLLADHHQWLEREDGTGRFYEGLPPFAAEMSPQGYIGRGFTKRHPELALPPRIDDWRVDHQLIALARRGEDCTGDLIIGDESLNRFLGQTPSVSHRGDYPELARVSMAGQPGSSAGGEQPKFATYSEGRHVLVKFSGDDESAAARRWRDLLISESFALETVRAAGLPAATSRSLSIEGRQFLEVERFDRVGLQGRRALLSLGAIDDEYFGYRDSWRNAAERMLSQQFISAEDARRIRWLDVFGQLIGNSDRHFGNLSFFVEEDERVQLAPIYDMLPMLFAPVNAEILEKTFTPDPPAADTFDVWPDAARWAVKYWERLVESNELSDEFRERCRHCGSAVEALSSRISGP